MKRRTGILSDNKTVRHIAKNVLILFSWAGQMETLLPEMVPIFDYKPIQMLNKMEGLLHQDFDRISHYDLMFYSEMSKDLLKLFASRDSVTERQALRQPDQNEAEEEKKEEPAQPEESKVKVDLEKPVDLAAALAARGKKGKDKKKGKKAAKGKKDGFGSAKPAAAAAASAPA